MKPEIVGRILKLPVLEPNDPLIISGCADGEPRVIVRRGLVRFGSKDAFLGCPMFYENNAYAEAVLLTVENYDGGDALEIVLENADALEELIDKLTKVRDRLAGSDIRYDQIVGFEQIWDAAQDDMREEMRETFAADIEVPDGFALCPACVGVKSEIPVICTRCGGERVVSVVTTPDPENAIDAGGF